MIERFRRDVTFYLLGIVIPGGINFLAIPVFKHMLGESAYGQFTLLFTAMLISNTALVGWIGQSVIRVGMKVDQKEQFMSYSLWVSLLITLLAALASLFLLSWMGFSWRLSLLFAASLVGSSQQVTLVAISQTFFRARLTMTTEALRVISFFAVGFCLLYFTGNSHGIEKLFLALLVSSVSSSLALVAGNHLSVHLMRLPLWAELKRVARSLFHYGIFLTLWFFLNYAMIYGDRYLVAYQYGNEVAGNYTALFDMIARSISLLGTPVLAAIFPIVTHEYEAGNRKAIDKLIRHVTWAEVAALLLGLAIYFLFGYDLLARILHLPSGDERYYWAGALVLSGSVIGQMGMLLHKRLELAKQTRQMLACVAMAFAVGMSLAFMLVKPWGILGTSLSYLAATSTYALLVIRKTRTR
jgi:O-antigen/teichoic acid export membrane protein